MGELKINDLKHDEHNFNKHTEEGLELLQKSIEENKFGRSIIVDKNNNIIGGNGVVEVSKRLGKSKTIVVETEGDELVVVRRKDIDINTTKGRSLALADNAVAELNWNIEELQEATKTWGIVPEDWGIDMPKPEEPTAKEDNFVAAESKIESRCKIGDMWILGKHRLLCGDSTNAEDIKKLMGGERADLVFTDPPYGMKKEAEGVINDNLNYADLLEFNKKWIPLTFDALKDNGSWYCWGIIQPLMDIYSEILKKAEKIVFRNLIVWKKGAFGSGGGTGVGQDIQRSYFPETEFCLFYMKGEQGFNTNADNYFEGWEKIRTYLIEEKNKMGWNAEDIKNIIGVTTGTHYFSKSQWAFPTKEHYSALQNAAKQQAFNRQYEAFKREYEEIKREYYNTRAYFNNTHDMMTDVWEFGRSRGAERKECGGHATPKPIALCERGIKTSTREGEIVLDVFGGSGSTLIACEQLNRQCRMLELSPEYCDVIIQRWENYTGQKAVKQ